MPAITKARRAVRAYIDAKRHHLRFNIVAALHRIWRLRHECWAYDALASIARLSTGGSRRAML